MNYSKPKCNELTSAVKAAALLESGLIGQISISNLLEAKTISIDLKTLCRELEDRLDPYGLALREEIAARFDLDFIEEIVEVNGARLAWGQKFLSEAGFCLISLDQPENPKILLDNVIAKSNFARGAALVEDIGPYQINPTLKPDQGYGVTVGRIYLIDNDGKVISKYYRKDSSSYVIRLLDQEEEYDGSPIPFYLRNEDEFVPNGKYLKHDGKRMEITQSASDDVSFSDGVLWTTNHKEEIAIDENDHELFRTDYFDKVYPFHDGEAIGLKKSWVSKLWSQPNFENYYVHAVAKDGRRRKLPFQVTVSDKIVEKIERKGDYFTAVLEGQLCYFNLKGEKIVPKEHCSQLGDFHGEYGYVVEYSMPDSIRYWFIDKNGERVTSDILQIEQFSEGTWLAYTGKEWLIIDEKLQATKVEGSDKNIYAMSSFSDGLARAANSQKREILFINKEGKIAFRTGWNAGNFQGGVVLSSAGGVMEDGSDYDKNARFLDRKGRVRFRKGEQK